MESEIRVREKHDKFLYAHSLEQSLVQMLLRACPDRLNTHLQTPKDAHCYTLTPNEGFVWAVKAHLTSKQDSPEMPEFTSQKQTHPVTDGSWQASSSAPSPSTAMREAYCLQSSGAPQGTELQQPIAGTCLARTLYWLYSFLHLPFLSACCCFLGSTPK